MTLLGIVFFMAGALVFAGVMFLLGFAIGRETQTKKKYRREEVPVPRIKTPPPAGHIKQDSYPSQHYPGDGCDLNHSGPAHRTVHPRPHRKR